MRWPVALLALCAACRPASNAREVAPGVVAIACPSGPQQCRQRAITACPSGFDIIDAAGRESVAYVGEIYVRCRGSVAPQGLGYRDCMGPESCERGDRCVFTPGSVGYAGRCMSTAP